MPSARILAWAFTLILAIGEMRTNCSRGVLVTSRALATGRTLRAGVPPQSHSAHELISFWADDQIAIP